MTARPLDRILKASQDQVRKSGMLTETVRMGVISAVGSDGTITVSVGDSSFPRVRLLSGYGDPKVADRVEIANTAGGWVCLGKLVTANPSKWTDLPLRSNWAGDVSSTDGHPQCRVMNGVVRLRGRADWTGSGNPPAGAIVADLPVELTPDIRHWFYSATNATTTTCSARVDVTTSATIALNSIVGAFKWVGLAMISYTID